jgi:hypothetical protein
MLFAAATMMAVGYVAYVLWPRWPEAPVAFDTPSLPVVIGGVDFNIEPAAIRMAVQRRPGTQERVDLYYLWPALTPPGPPAEPSLDGPAEMQGRLFVTIQAGTVTLPVAERLHDIYPRYLAPEPMDGPAGLTVRLFRDDTPYTGEELVFESQAPEHFLARCSRHGVGNDGMCLLERRIGGADLTFRFPRDWLADWRGVAKGIDKLLARLHPT